MAIPKEYLELYNLALSVRENATALFSEFKVGAALECESGKVYTGCNVESSSYGMTICAERVALTKAISEGERKFKRVLIVADTPSFCSPCGACRQLLIDYATDLEVVMTNLHGDCQVSQLKELLKFYFSASDLKK